MFVAERGETANGLMRRKMVSDLDISRHEIQSTKCTCMHSEIILMCKMFLPSLRIESKVYAKCNSPEKKKDIKNKLPHLLGT